MCRLPGTKHANALGSVVLMECASNPVSALNMNILLSVTTCENVLVVVRPIYGSDRGFVFKRVLYFECRSLIHNNKKRPSSNKNRVLQRLLPRSQFQLQPGFWLQRWC
eukprot:m.155699 g.155699  ORF g.155699 m.155699 type:complete len:108 (+) comp13327_c1_seq3:1071-1394(+)